MRTLDLFAGCGGSLLAGSMLGWQAVAAFRLLAHNITLDTP